MLTSICILCVSFDRVFSWVQCSQSLETFVHSSHPSVTSGLMMVSRPLFKSHYPCYLLNGTQINSVTTSRPVCNSPDLSKVVTLHFHVLIFSFLYCSYLRFNSFIVLESFPRRFFKEILNASIFIRNWNINYSYDVSRVGSNNNTW